MTCQKTLDELDLTLNLVMMKNSNYSKESVENYINLWTTMSEYNIKYWKDCLVINESYINQEITLKEFKKQKHLIDLSYGYTYE